MSTSEFGTPDIVVVGGGNAAACAALSARERGSSVVMLEAAPAEESGGNSRYTAGLMRYAFRDVEELGRVITDLTEDEKTNVDFGTYTQDEFFDDMGRITQYRTDPDLCELLVTRSLETMVWMRQKGIRFQASYGRQAFKVGGRFKFWGGAPTEAWGGGPGLVELEHSACAREGVRIFYDTPVRSLLVDGEGVIQGVCARHRGREVSIRCKAVILACGGFESDAEMRARYLGPNWDLAKVRGTRFNTGLGIRMALDAGAQPYGHWSGCHAVAWDQNAPPFGDLEVGDGFQKHSYPLGVMVNARGERFVDEGADFRNFTYAKYGAVILAQPGMFAWQIFDKKVTRMLRDEYRIKQVTRVKADTLQALVEKLDGVNQEACLSELQAYNQAVRVDIPFDPAIKDGRCTLGLKVPKSNWANRLDAPPFEAFAVTCGVTFTFGGLKISKSAEVEDRSGRPIPGLYAAGELVGGLFYHNYPGGTGLTSGAVFGRIAGNSASSYLRPVHNHF